MKMFGSWSELVAILFRKNSQNITVRPNQSTTYTADRTFDLPPGDSSQVLASATSTQTFTNKSIDADTNTITNIDDGEIKAAAAINATKIADGSVDNTEFQRLGTAGTAGSGNLVTTDAAQTLSNKTLDETNNIETQDTKTVIENLSDSTKRFRFDASGITTGNLRILTVPDGDAILVGEANTQTLTNKTIDGDTNTVQDLALTSLKTVIGDANKVIRRDAAGVVISGNALPNSSAIVTIDAAQVITLKDIDGGTATNTSRITVPKDTTANLNALTRKAGTVVYDTTTSQLKYDDGATLNTLAASATLDSSQDIQNLSISPSVAANALTIALKTKAGSDATSGDPIKIAFRNATNATGDYSVVSVTGSLSAVISSGSTLGHLSATREPIYVYALNNAGTVELAYSTTLFDCTINQSTTAEGGAGAADSRTTLYSTTTRSNVAIRLIGKLVSSQTTAGTWASSMSEVKLLPLPDTHEVSKTVQDVQTLTYSAGYGTVTNSSFSWYRVGDRMIGRATAKNGTIVSSVASITLPSGITINDSKMFPSDGQHIVGRAQRIRTGGTPAPAQIVEVFYDGADNTKLFFAIASASDALSKTNGGDWFSTNDYTYTEFDIPVTAWAL